MSFKSAHADPKPGYDNARYYAIQITASQINRAMLPQAFHWVAIANLQLYHAISQKRCKLAPKLL